MGLDPAAASTRLWTCSIPTARMSASSKWTSRKFAANVCFAAGSQSSAKTTSNPAAWNPQLAPPQPEKKSKTLIFIVFWPLPCVLRVVSAPAGRLDTTPSTAVESYHRGPILTASLSARRGESNTPLVCEAVSLTRTSGLAGLGHREESLCQQVTESLLEAGAYGPRTLRKSAASCWQPVRRRMCGAWRQPWRPARIVLLVRLAPPTCTPACTPALPAAPMG